MEIMKKTRHEERVLKGCKKSLALLKAIELCVVAPSYQLFSTVVEGSWFGHWLNYDNLSVYQSC